MNPQTPYSPQIVAECLGGRFTVDEVLRVGGQGAVYRASRIASPNGQTTNENVALKLYLDPGQNERVEREIRALEGFFHPNLANIIEHGTVELPGGVTRYIAWEFIVGRALDDRLTRGILQPRVAACVGRDISRAISHIWTKRIVHRDVNPKNIMLRQGEKEAVLIDLGVARHLSESTLTSPGLTWGTRGYLSPEQCRTETQLTCQSDVFSLGIALQEGLCGHHPTGGDQGMLNQAPRNTADLAPQIPGGLAALIDSMLKIRAAFRPSPDALVNEFANLVTRL